MPNPAVTLSHQFLLILLFHIVILTLSVFFFFQMCFIGKTRSYKQQEEHEVDVKRQAFIDKRTIYSSHQKLEKPGSGQPVSHVSQDRGSMSCCSAYTEKYMPLLEEIISSHEQSLSPPRQNMLNGCLNGGHENFISVAEDQVSCLSHSEKRKHENLGSQDSGFSELEFESYDETCTKRHKGDCGEEDCEILSTDPENSETVEKSSDTITCLSSNVGSCNTSLSDKTTSKTPQAAVQTWVKDFQPRVEPGVRNCQRVPEQVKSLFVQVAFQLVLDAPGGTNVLLASGKTWNKGGECNSIVFAHSILCCRGIYIYEGNKKTTSSLSLGVSQTG